MEGEGKRLLEIGNTKFREIDQNKEEEKMNRSGNGGDQRSVLNTQHPKYFERSISVFHHFDKAVTVFLYMLQLSLTDVC